MAALTSLRDRQSTDPRVGQTRLVSGGAREGVTECDCFTHLVEEPYWVASVLNCGVLIKKKG